MFCSLATLQKHLPAETHAKVLKCRSWQCEICRPDRAKELIAQAIRGKATRFLTLTVSRHSGDTVNERAQNLVKAWRKLRSEIAANLAIPKELRWRSEFLDSGSKRFEKRSRADAASKPITQDEPRPEFSEPDPMWPDARKALRLATRCKETMRRHSIEFLAVVEAQKNGEAHLHIMLRSGDIPYEWLSARMDEMIRAPILWIERVEGSKKLANYVAKYCGKDPHRFGTLKRYWSSKNWCAKWQRDNAPNVHRDCTWSRLNQTLDEWIRTAKAMNEKVIYRRPWAIALRCDHPDYDDTENEF